MANFLESLGRTNALPQAIQTLENRAITNKEFALQERRIKLDEDKFKLLEKETLQQQKRDNHPIPTSTLQNFFKVPSVYNYAKDIASSLGYLEDTGGVETISRKDATQVFSLLQSKEHAPKLSQMRIRHWATQRDQLKAALAQAQEKGNEKNISKLGQALAGAEQQLSLAVSQHKDLDQYFDLIGKGYKPENVQKAIETGDFSVLGEPTQKPSGAAPYFTPVQSSEGFFTFNNRTGRFEPATGVEGKPIVPVAADVGLAGRKEETKATAKGFGESNLEQYNTAQTSIASIQDIDRLINHLETSDAITGLGAEVLNNIERAKALLGDKAAEGTVSDTELLDTMMGAEVFPMIKQLGVGARGLDTPAEREFMRKVLTGSIQLQKTTLIKMAQIRKNIAERAIKKWNKRIKTGELNTFFKTTGIPKEEIKLQSNGTTQAPQAPQGAIDYLRTHPSLKEEFRQKYGYVPEGI